MSCSSYFCMMRSAAIDIGNTRIKVGLFDNGRLVEQLYSAHRDTEDASNAIRSFGPKRIISSSTADEEFTIEELIPEGCHYRVLDPSTPVPIEVDYDRNLLGQDRLANAIVGDKLNSKASLVIDAGTCVTYDWTANGIYMGGSISPGFRMRLIAMHHFTGRLPLIEELDLTEPVGKDTQGAMSNGAFQGLVYEIDGVIKDFLSRFPEGKAFLTGGDCTILADAIENDIFADPWLTVVGLHGILEYNNA